MDKYSEILKKILIFSNDIFGIRIIPEEDEFTLLKRAVLGKNKLHHYLRKVKPEHSFKLMKNKNEIIAEIFSLEELSNILEIAPEEAIIFHIKDNRNDFATWIRDVIGNKELSEKLKNVNHKNPEELRWKIVSIIYNEIITLKLSQLYTNNL